MIKKECWKVDEKNFVSMRVDFSEDGAERLVKSNCSYGDFIYFVGFAIMVAASANEKSIDSVVGDAMRLISNGMIEGID